MSAVTQRASVPKTGARAFRGPSRTERIRLKSVNAFRKVGIYVRSRMDGVQEGDLIVVPDGTFCIIRKDSSCKGSLMFVRDVLSRNVRSMRFEPMAWSQRLRVEQATDRGRNWTISSGDVVAIKADRPWEDTVLIRHTRMWMPTAAPWIPFGDAEVLLALKEGRAHVLRNSWRPGVVGLRDHLPPGTVVATRNRKEHEPSVYLHVAPNRWVSNSRGAHLSTDMIRLGLSRRTYEVLKPPETGR